MTTIGKDNIPFHTPYLARDVWGYGRACHTMSLPTSLNVEGRTCEEPALGHRGARLSERSSRPPRDKLR